MHFIVAMGNCSAQIASLQIGALKGGGNQGICGFACSHSMQAKAVASAAESLLTENRQALALLKQVLRRSPVRYRTEQRVGVSGPRESFC